MQPQLNYEELKSSYKRFLKNPPKNEFSRWYNDFMFLNSLIEFAKSANLDKDVFEFQQKRKVAYSKLHELGYQIEEG